jgi:pimeloyl-ACP methyl ester carboxylesterase
MERGLENPAETFLLGPEWMSQRMYQLSPAEVTQIHTARSWQITWCDRRVAMQDLTLAKTLVRPAQMFLGDEAMAGENVLTWDRYGAVSRVFVVTEEDRTWPAEEQLEAAASCGPGVEVRAIRGADHMPMFSKPAELAQLILEVAQADKYN